VNYAQQCVRERERVRECVRVCKCMCVCARTRVRVCAYLTRKIVVFNQDLPGAHVDDLRARIDWP
jgi:hypothetical protein